MKFVPNSINWQQVFRESKLRIDALKNTLSLNSFRISSNRNKCNDYDEHHNGRELASASEVCDRPIKSNFIKVFRLANMKIEESEPAVVKFCCCMLNINNAFHKTLSNQFSLRFALLESVTQPYLRINHYCCYFWQFSDLLFDENVRKGTLSRAARTPLNSYQRSLK